MFRVRACYRASVVLHGSRCFGRGHVNVLVKFYMEVDVSGGRVLTFW